MRQIIFVIAILVVFASLARLVWVESQVLAEAYEIQRLRRLDGRNMNDVRMFELTIEERVSDPEMDELARRLDLGLGAARILPRREWQGPEAAH
ncbi:MAG: hypothetical protein H6807_05520 [Planctomycetes bacterium]|nr:hypothetical protein [Planctomycetota bacterium]